MTNEGLLIGGPLHGTWYAFEGATLCCSELLNPFDFRTLRFWTYRRRGELYGWAVFAGHLTGGAPPSG